MSATTNCPYASMTGMMTMGNGEVMPWADMCPPSAGEERCDMSTAMMMLWNWQTINACFISDQWRIKNSGHFAGTCIGVFVWGVALQALMRGLREFDRYLVQNWSNRGDSTAPSGVADRSNCLGLKKNILGPIGYDSTTQSEFKPWQQILRSWLHAVEFGASYLFMLMAMYYNGYVLICMFLGQLFGFFIFAWDNVGSISEENNESTIHGLQ